MFAIELLAEPAAIGELGEGVGRRDLLESGEQLVCATANAHKVSPSELVW